MQKDHKYTISFEKQQNKVKSSVTMDYILNAERWTIMQCRFFCTRKIKIQSGGSLGRDSHHFSPFTIVIIRSVVVFCFRTIFQNLLLFMLNISSQTDLSCYFAAWKSWQLTAVLKRLSVTSMKSLKLKQTAVSLHLNTVIKSSTHCPPQKSKGSEYSHTYIYINVQLRRKTLLKKLPKKVQIFLKN